MDKAATIGILALLAASAFAGDGRKVNVVLRLSSGGQVAGQACDYDQERIILEVQGQPVALQWAEVDTQSAYEARRKMLESARGSLQNLTAEDHFQLGYFLAARNHHTAAVAEFRMAEQRDTSYAERINRAWRDIRTAKESNIASSRTLTDSRPGESNAVGGRTRHGMSYMTFTPEQHEEALRALRAFEQFPEANRAGIPDDLVLLETQHFLVWTDWSESSRNLIPDWAEQMYRELCREFGFPADEPVWLGKCPLFCFRNEKNFKQFSDRVDGYDSTGVLGYTKTHPSGYVHVVLRSLGPAPIELDKFATTMVHEGTHAFMHCYGSSRNLPAWLSEGLADYVAERVLGQRSPTGENAAMMAGLYVRERKSIEELFEFDRSPPAQFYPIAHSLVEYLVERDNDAFVRMINDIKAGVEAEAAMRRQYKGLETRTLELSWRSWVRKTTTP